MISRQRRRLGKLFTGKGLAPRKRAGQNSGMKVYWFTDHEQGGFPVERSALGGCDLSAAHCWGIAMAGPAQRRYPFFVAVC
jgi:hypothetical protein